MNYIYAHQKKFVQNYGTIIIVIFDFDYTANEAKISAKMAICESYSIL